jgi:hypothetical protein
VRSGHGVSPVSGEHIVMARSETYMVCSGGIATIVRGWVVSDGGTTKSVLLGSVTESGTTLNARDVLCCPSKQFFINFLTWSTIYTIYVFVVLVCKLSQGGSADGQMIGIAAL